MNAFKPEPSTLEGQGNSLTIKAQPRNKFEAILQQRGQEKRAAHYQRLFKRIGQEANSVTGILLLMPTVAMHIIEAPRDVVYAYMRDLNNELPTFKGGTSQGDRPKSGSDEAPQAPVEGNLHGLSATQRTAAAYVRNPRVILMQDDVTRAYPFWVSRVVDGPRAHVPIDALNTALPTPEDTWEAAKASAATAKALLHLGGRLGTLHKNDVKSFLEDTFSGTTSGNSAAMLPPSDVLGQLLQSPAVMTAAEYLTVFEDRLPYDVGTQSHQDWPAPTWMFLAGMRAITHALETKDDARMATSGSTTNLAT